MSAAQQDEEVRSWVTAAMEGADDKLAQRTEAFFVGEVMGITDWFVVTSGANPRQVRAIVQHIEEAVFLAEGPKPRSIEGMDELSWVLMDFGVFVVHVFSTEARDYYELDRLWDDVPRLERTA